MRLSRGATLSHFLGPDYEIRSVRLLNGTLQQGRRFVKAIRVEGTVVAVVSSAPEAFAQAPPSGPTARRWILGVGGAPAAVGLGLLVLVLVRRRQLGLAIREPALAGLTALVFYLTPVSVALAAIPDGDVNDDGLLNGADVMLGQRIVDGTLSPTQSQQDSADVAPLEVAPDGTIDASDVLLLTRGAGEEDVDGDGLSDSAELAAGTSPFRKDTDQDGLADGLEPTGGGLNPDSDSDGLVDGEDQDADTPAAPIETHWIHTDHLGGSSVVTNASGTVVRQFRYGIFGEVRSNVVPVGAPTTTSDPREKYTGQRYDSASALYYYGARYYDPALGRFIQADSVVQAPYDPQALNRYSYVRNDPLGRVDPTGYFSIGDFGGGGFWGGVSDFVGGAGDFIGGLIPSFAGGGSGVGPHAVPVNHAAMLGEQVRQQLDRQWLAALNQMRPMTPAEVALQQRWAQRVAAKMGFQIAQPTSISRGQNAVLSDEQVVNIVFNETRSLSGSGMNAARAAIADTIINADEYWGAQRAIHARTAPETLPGNFSHAVEGLTLESIRSVVGDVRSWRAGGYDSAADATNFNLRGFSSTRPPAWAPGFHVQATYGPLNNTIGPAQYVHIWSNPNAVY